MELTPALQRKVDAAIRAAIMNEKPRPAVDRILTSRTSGKWVHYCQVLLSYAPGKHGLAYVNLHNFKVKVHGPETKPGRFITAIEERLVKKAEKAIARKQSRQLRGTA